MIEQHKVASVLGNRDVLAVTSPFNRPRASGEDVKAPIGAHAFEFMISSLMEPALSKGMENVEKIQLQARAIVCRSRQPQATPFPSPCGLARQRPFEADVNLAVWRTGCAGLQCRCGSDAPTRAAISPGWLTRFSPHGYFCKGRWPEAGKRQKTWLPMP